MQAPQQMTHDIATLRTQLEASTSPNEIGNLICLLKQISQEETDSEELWILLGHAYRKLQKWQDSLNCYAEALRINPKSKARVAYEQIIEILDFFNKDLFNQ